MVGFKDLRPDTIYVICVCFPVCRGWLWMDGHMVVMEWWDGCIDDCGSDSKSMT